MLIKEVAGKPLTAQLRIRIQIRVSISKGFITCSLCFALLVIINDPFDAREHFLRVISIHYPVIY